MNDRIRINLVPFGEVRSPGRKRLHRFVEVAAVAATALVLLAFTWREWNTEAGLEDRLAGMRSAVANENTRQALEQNLAALKRDLSMLKTITARNRSHESIVRGISQALPNAVWLTRFELTEQTLILEGRAKHHRLITRFLHELESQPHFVETQLVEVRQPKQLSDETSTRFATRSHIISAEKTDELEREAAE